MIHQIELTKDDDYSNIKDHFIPTELSLQDSTLLDLTKFDVRGFKDCIKANRLYLEKGVTPDFASTLYGIHLNDEQHTLVGNITILATGEVRYKVFENYRGNGYAREALCALKDSMFVKELFLNICKDNEKAIQVAVDAGFTLENPNTAADTLKFRLKKSE